MALSPRDRRVLMIGGGIVGAAIVLFLAFNLLSGGGEESGLPPPPSGTDSTVAPTESPSPTDSPSTVFNPSGRDPFSPPAALAEVSTSPAGATDGGGGTGTSTSTDTSTSTTSTSSIPPTGGGTGTNPPPTKPPKPPPSCKGEKKTECQEVGNHVVLLLKVYKRHHKPVADIKVNKKEYKGLREGDRFAHNFKLVGFNDENCPRIVFGEEGFTLCESRKKKN